MALANLSWPLAIGGLAALAGALYLLQRLRVRHRDVEVVTTLFWRAAIEDTRARVRTRRFRHLPAYLLSLLLVSALWFAIADPTTEDTDLGEVVLLLDASGTTPERLAQLANAVDEQLSSLPPSRRRVVLLTDRPRTLLAPDEQAPLFRARLGDAVPVARSSAALDTVALWTEPARATSFVVFGDAPLTGHLPENATVRRAEVEPAAAAGPRVTALGITRARSGSHSYVDVRVEVAGAASATVTHDDEPLDAVFAPGPDGRHAALIRDVPANGGRVRVQLGEGPWQSAEARLPRRSRTRVFVEPELRPLVADVLTNDPAVEWTDDRAAAELLVTSDPTVELPALVLVNDEQEAAIFVGHDPAEASTAAVERAFRELALGRIDATSLATEAGRPIVLSVEPTPTPQVRIWRSLLTDRFNFTRSRAFPVFIARTVRRLAGDVERPAVFAAGRRVEWDLALTDDAGRTWDALGDSTTPPTAGDFRTAGGVTITAAALAPALDSAGPTSTTEHDSPGGGPDAKTWLALLALALLLTEWVLYRTGRIP